MATEIKKERVYGNFKSKGPKRKKKKQVRPGMSEEHLKNIRLLPCINCANTPSEVHHLKCTGERGVGMRSTDKWGVPLCHECHINGVEKVGSRKEVRWFQDRGIDCLVFASALWANGYDLKAMEKVWIAHWDRKARILKQQGGE